MLRLKQTYERVLCANPACTHPDAKHRAKGYCRNCYAVMSERKRTKKNRYTKVPESLILEEE